ncbi:NAD-dependent epimerase [Paenibacillus baekrokdamisoli]|uniref:NAD-dependent epimerase n=1 Tax=Paenibacillus baekrokdamisoli TaxID=1712516 RepID=A0A3G9J0F9_9BACL|nr:NAD-dependent epimerase/dehydratase family protein [Paenibacillus baekrokdamisoli]MBB3071655.1 CDP-paratose 2-epimerase [Paenibacillus baekrokdamisoli]BBH21835.1 NAD-dependent epimerase [Paenibacillus baekrokdamisoli]
MSVVIVTGSAGLIGSEAVDFYAGLGYKVVGIDNNMRQTFFGEEGSTHWNRQRLESSFGSKYEHHDVDIRDFDAICKIFQIYGTDIELIIHTAAQPSHDWAARDPLMDFGINANGTLHMLEATRQHCPEAVFIFTSTNKVYGDSPNRLPLVERETRYEIAEEHAYKDGITEDLSVDQNMHSLFGASKLSADILVQEYGRYFNFKTVCFRGGVLSGPRQSGVQLHGFINYLMKCAMTSAPYTIFGYKGKQVRDVIHCNDVIAAFHTFFSNPRRGGEVYNLGGGPTSNISMLEAIAFAEQITDRKMEVTYTDEFRAGDHIWYVSGLTKFRTHYPEWNIRFDVKAIMEEIVQANQARWSVAK